MRYQPNPETPTASIGERMEGQTMTTQDSGTTPAESAVPTFPTEAPAKAAPTTKALWPEAVKAFETMTKAAEAVGQVKGSAGEFLAKAKAAVLDTEEGKYVSDMVAEFAAAIGRGQAFLDEAASQIAAESMKDLTPKREAAEAKYAEAAADFDAALTFIAKDKAAASVVAKVTRPTLPKSTRSTSGGGTKAATVTGLAYYRTLKGGTKEYQPATQNKVSSLAYYFAGCVASPPAAKGNVGALVQYGASKGVDVQAAAPWTLTLPNGTVLGADKVGGE